MNFLAVSTRRKIPPACATAVLLALGLIACEQKTASSTQEPKPAPVSRVTIEEDAAIAEMLRNAFLWNESGDVFLKTMMADPNNARVLDGYRTVVAGAGYLGVAARVGENAEGVDSAAYDIHRAGALLITGRTDEAISILESVPSGADNYFRNLALARAYAGAGRFDTAADTLLAINTDQTNREQIEAAAAILRTAPMPASDPAKLPAIHGLLGFVYAFVGAKERSLEAFDGIGAESFYWIWDPVYASLRNTEPFKAILIKVGLPDYWRVKAWPDLCHPLGRTDFVCD